MGDPYPRSSPNRIWAEAAHVTWSLRWHITALFVVAILLVTGAATAFGLQRARSEIKESVVQQQRESGEGAANGINYFLESAGRSLGSTAAVLQRVHLYPSLDNRTLNGLFDPLVAYSQDFRAIHLVNTQGQSLLIRPASAGSLKGLFAENPVFQQTQRDGRPNLSLEADSGGPFWITPVPSTREDPNPYFLVGVLNLRRVSDVLILNLPPHSDAMLVTERGTILATTNGLLAHAETQESDGSAPLELKAQLASLEREDILTENALPTYSGRVVVASPKSQVARMQAQLVTNGVLIASGLAGTAIVLGIVATHTVTRPLSDVRTAAHQMREGELRVRARVRGPRELKELAVDFNAMAESLEHKQSELMRFQRHLEDLVRRRTEELDRKREEMELFFYGVSHDMKSPIIAISAFAQFAQEELGRVPHSNPEVADFVERIRHASQNLQALISELMQFARATRSEPTYRRFEVGRLLRDVVDEAQPFAKERHVRLVGQGRPVAIETDADRLRQVASNLVHNAIKHMPAKSDAWVRVAWGREGNDLVLEVADNGTGIPAEVQRNLFRPFARHLNKATDASGAGLGLSIVKRFVDSLGGQIELQSSAKTGTTFTVRIPSQGPSTREEPR